MNIASKRQKSGASSISARGEAETMATRIQRKRTKGWKMPAGAVYVGRPTKWGNPFLKIVGVSAESAVRRYRELMLDTTEGPNAVETIRKRLRGKDLACWCKLDQPCHADVLLEIANSGGSGHEE
jgi:hypothetical protein